MLGGFVADLVGATRLQFQRSVAAAQGLGVAHATGIVARLVIGLADDQLRLGVKNVVLPQIIRISDHVLELAGIVVLGELRLGAAGGVGIGRGDRDRALELGDDGVIIRSRGSGLRLIQLGLGAGKILGRDHGLGFLQQRADLGADGGGLSGGRQDHGGADGGGAQKERRQGDVQFTNSHDKTS